MKTTGTIARAALAQFGIAGFARQAIPVAIGGLLLWYLSRHLAEIDAARVVSALQTIQPGQWAGGVLATGASFWAVGRYDGVVHRFLATRTPAPQARRAGIAAIAISQTLGMGLLTGSVVRWRLLPDHSLWQATRLSLIVALSFLAGWAVVTATVLVILPPPLPMLRPVAATILAVVSVLVLFSILRADRFAAMRFPPFRTIVRIIALAGCDTGAAALCFIILMPVSAHLPADILIPAFMLALGAGLATGTPGGVGPFELTLVTLLPATEPEPLLAAILAFRLIYYAIPALLAGVLVILGPKASATPAAGFLLEDTAVLLPTLRAEAQIIQQGQFEFWKDNAHPSFWMLANAGQALVVLGDPFGTPSRAADINLRHFAKTRDQLLCHYKCSARRAATLRRSGYATALICQDAILSPQTFDPRAPARAPLRRKLRKAEKVGVRIVAAQGPLPLRCMAAVSAAWVRNRGSERGFSMGCFHPPTLQTQAVYLAYIGQELVAFLSFYTGANDWSLNLMRYSDKAPDGTVYALMVHAIQDAAALGLQRISLAAVPPNHAGGLCRLIERASGGSGLRQFKSAFAPDWVPLYMAAPTKVALGLAGLEIARAIAWPIAAKTGVAHPSRFAGHAPHSSDL